MKQVIVERRKDGTYGAHPRERHVFLAGRQRLAVPLRTDARDVRAYLLFDGEQLEVSAALLDVPVTIDGRRVGGAWTPLHTPSVLRVGGVQFDVYTEEDCNGKTSSCRVVVAAPNPHAHPHRDTIRDMRARLDTLPLDMHPLVLATPPAPLPTMMPTEDTATAAFRRSQPPPASRPAPQSLPMQQLPTTISRHRAPIEARRRKMLVAAATGAITAVVTLVVVLGFPPIGLQPAARVTTAAAK